MEETKSLSTLLAEAQAEMPNPKKDREGQKGYQKYKYATLDKVLDTAERARHLHHPAHRHDR